MAIEWRDGRFCYYTKERAGGSGIMAVMMAQEDEQRRRDKRRERQAARRACDQLTAQDEALDELGKIVKELTGATLIANGFHQHKRVWRRKRQ